MLISSPYGSSVLDTECLYGPKELAVNSSWGQMWQMWHWQPPETWSEKYPPMSKNIAPNGVLHKMLNIEKQQTLVEY